MRNILLVALMAYSDAALAQEVDLSTKADVSPLDGTRAFLCHLGAEVILAPFREAEDGSLEPQGWLMGWQITQTGDRISLVRADTFLQIDGANSLGVTGGELVQGDCLDVSSEVLQLIAVALGGEPGQMIFSLRETWIGRAQEAEEEVESLRSDLAGLRRAEGPCAEQAKQILPWIAEGIDALERSDVAAGQRYSAARTMRSRVLTLQRVCGAD